MKDTRRTVETAQYVSIGVMSTLLTDGIDDDDGIRRAEIIHGLLRQGFADVDDKDQFELLVCIVAILGNSHAHLIRSAFDHCTAGQRMHMCADVITRYVQRGLEEYETT